MGFFSSIGQGLAAIATGGISEIPGVKESVTGAVDQVSGKAGATAARDAAETQVSAAEAAQQQLAGRTAPFEQLGRDSGGQLIGSVLQPNQFAQPQLQTPEQTLSNPFFQAMARQQDEATINQRAALGLGGSGGTEDALRRQQLLLGNQFQQQDFGNQQQVFSNQMQQNQQRFNQLFNTTGLGANAAIGAGTQIANLQTGAGAAQAAGIVGQQNARAGGFNNLLNIGGAVVGGLGGIGGMFGGAGGAGAGLGAGSAVGGFNTQQLIPQPTSSGQFRAF